MLSNKSSEALKYFQSARESIDQLDITANPISALITFSEIVAYDCLRLIEPCKEKIGELFVSIEGYEPEDMPEWNSKNAIIKKPDSYASAIDFLQNLALIAPSSEVQGFLLRFVDDVQEELLLITENGGFCVDSAQYSRESFSIELCKRRSFWKKFRTWCKEFADWLSDAVKILQGAKQLKDSYNEWKQKNGGADCSLEEFVDRQSHELGLIG